MPPRLLATQVGATAHAALLRSSGEIRIVGVLSRSFYATAAREIVWIGHGDVPAHPRSVLLAGSSPGKPGSDLLRVETEGARVWQPPEIPRGRASTIVERARALGPSLAGRLAAAGTLHAAPAIAAALRGLAAACGADDAAAAEAPALALVGLGPGLTPSGDDLVGGALLARTVLARDGLADEDGWMRVARTVRTRARQVTHPISAALLGDMLDLNAWGPVHALLGALACRVARDEVQRLVHDIEAIGSSSGHSLLLGILAGLLGEHTPLGLG